MTENPQYYSLQNINKCQWISKQFSVTDLHATSQRGHPAQPGLQTLLEVWVPTYGGVRGAPALPAPRYSSASQGCCSLSHSGASPLAHLQAPWFQKSLHNSLVIAYSGRGLLWSSSLALSAWDKHSCGFGCPILLTFLCYHLLVLRAFCWRQTKQALPNITVLFNNFEYIFK